MPNHVVRRRPPEKTGPAGQRRPRWPRNITHIHSDDIRDFNEKEKHTK